MKTIIIWVVVGVVAVGLGVGARVMFQQKKAGIPGQQNAVIPGQPVVVVPQNVKADRQPLKCAYTQNYGNAVELVIYVADNKILTERRRVKDGMLNNELWIDGHNYTWIPGFNDFGNDVNMGTKIQEGELDALYNDTLNTFGCKPWTPDMSKLELPKDVKFKTIVKKLE